MALVTGRIKWNRLSEMVGREGRAGRVGGWACAWVRVCACGCVRARGCCVRARVGAVCARVGAVCRLRRPSGRRRWGFSDTRAQHEGPRAAGTRPGRGKVRAGGVSARRDGARGAAEARQQS